MENCQEIPFLLLLEDFSLTTLLGLQKRTDPAPIPGSIANYLRDSGQVTYCLSLSFLL